MILMFSFCYFIILINYAVVFFRRTSRDILLRTLHTHLGPELWTSLLGFHALTECDQTGTFAGFYKKMWWKVLVDASPDASSAFRYVGQCKISDDIKAGLEKFLLNLYCKDRPSDVNTMGSLLWYLFSMYAILAFLLNLGIIHR